MTGMSFENPSAQPNTTEGAAPRRVIILDADPGVRWALERGLSRSGYEVLAAGTPTEALEFLYRKPVDVVVFELLPEAGLTLDVLSMFLDTPGNPRVICVSVESQPHVVIECMRRGAADFLPKPFSLAEVRATLARVLASDSGLRGAAKAHGTPSAAPSSSLLIGISPSMQELRITVERVARTDLNCLIRGESGTGKDMVARELHRLSRRSDKPFVKVNCTALPEQLLESELFGYEKGAFTGAVASKPGRFELANRGIIFLDEIGDLHQSLQAKLLQVIEHKEFTKLGGKQQIHVDVQIVAATNADLEQKAKEGTFRDDLYFRLNEICIWVSPLSQRREDIPLLVRHFVQKHGRFSADAPFEISGEELAALTQHGWPGNVRELESTIKRWLALGKSALVTPKTPRGPARENPPSPRQPSPIVTGLRKKAAEAESEPQRIVAALERCQWNRRRAAEDLGISYQTLRRRMEKYGLNEET